MGMDRTLYFCLSSLERGEDIIFLRMWEGALKCLFRFLLRSEVTKGLNFILASGREEICRLLLVLWIFLHYLFIYFFTIYLNKKGWTWKCDLSLRKKKCWSRRWKLPPPKDLGHIRDIRDSWLLTTWRDFSFSEMDHLLESLTVKYKS